MLHYHIQQLVEYGIRCGMIPESEEIYSRNLLLDMYNEDSFAPSDVTAAPLEGILASLLQCAIERGLIQDSIIERDMWDTQLMNCITPRPSEVERKFHELGANGTDYFFKLSCDSNYIRTARVAKDKKWTADGEYGKMEITINLSKPEKLPADVAREAAAPKSGYPACMICRENVGYAGRVNHPTRSTLRTVPIMLGDETWELQYSPFQYYNEHCILLSREHRPMQINEGAFQRLLNFVEAYPHYFLGSNAELPGAGGSILSHDHYQGGRYELPMVHAEGEALPNFAGQSEVTAKLLKWPVTVIRLTSESKDLLVKLATHVLNMWREYSDLSVGIFAHTGDTPHNTISPIARKVGDKFELDLTLRSTVTTPEHPGGVFNPHAVRHHIKQESVGLIEVMGLAVLPPRLEREMAAIAKFLSTGSLSPTDVPAEISIHADWIARLRGKYSAFSAENVDKILCNEIGTVFQQVLSDLGVFKQNREGREAFDRFVSTL